MRENPKHAIGASKAPLGLVPKTAIAELSRVMELGAKKYGAYNWRENSVSVQVYIDAARRHLDLVECGEDLDDESRASHYAHVMACMSIVLDAIHTGTLVDDRHKSEAAVRALKAISEPQGINELDS